MSRPQLSIESFMAQNSCSDEQHKFNYATFEEIQFHIVELLHFLMLANILLTFHNNFSVLYHTPVFFAT